MTMIDEIKRVRFSYLDLAAVIVFADILGKVVEFVIE
jgi:hypothetical protein